MADSVERSKEFLYGYRKSSKNLNLFEISLLEDKEKE
jgi:hypothetical protein